MEIMKKAGVAAMSLTGLMGGCICVLGTSDAATGANSGALDAAAEV